MTVFDTAHLKTLAKVGKTIKDIVSPTTEESIINPSDIGPGKIHHLAPSTPAGVRNYPKGSYQSFMGRVRESLEKEKEQKQSAERMTSEILGKQSKPLISEKLGFRPGVQQISVPERKSSLFKSHAEIAVLVNRVVNKKMKMSDAMAALSSKDDKQEFLKIMRNKKVLGRETK